VDATWYMLCTLQDRVLFRYPNGMQTRVRTGHGTIRKHKPSIKGTHVDIAHTDVRNVHPINQGPFGRTFREAVRSNFLCRH